MPAASTLNATALRLTRRTLLRIGGVQVAGGFAAGLLPRNVWAAGGAAKPRGTARQVIFVNIEGGMSQVDTLDAKQGSWTPEYFDIRPCGNGLQLPFGLMPNLSRMTDRVAVVRSLAAWDAVHGRAQYYIQTGHPLNQALAREVPAIGAVVCHELAGTRKSSDSLPPYICMNMAGNQAGLLTQGFLPGEFGPLSLAVGETPPSLAPEPGTATTLARRWERLQALDGTLRGPRRDLERSYVDFHDYYRGAWSIMSDPRVARIFSLPEADRKRYGASTIGNSLLLARNLLQADAGARFILASHGGWDHHGDIYKEKSRSHPVLIRELDAALTALLRDLESTPSRWTAGKSLLDETLVVAVSEFGRTPGPISATRLGREHYIHAHAGLFAGGGVRKGAVLGKTDALGGKIVEPGWSANRPIYMEDLACTIYSALGIDWTKRISTTPSGRAFHYVEPASATSYVRFQPVEELFL
jgi:uncharacterized protein (DUF1501 family)